MEALSRIIIGGPLPIFKCYNLHALTIVIITKYMYILCGGFLVVEDPGQLPSLFPLKSNPEPFPPVESTKGVPMALLETKKIEFSTQNLNCEMCLLMTSIC